MEAGESAEDPARFSFGGGSPGPLELVRRSPAILVDAAHNPHGMGALREALPDGFTFTTLVGVVAKDAQPLRWGDAITVRPLGFDDDEALLPETLRAFSGQRLLQEILSLIHI